MDQYVKRYNLKITMLRDECERFLSASLFTSTKKPFSFIAQVVFHSMNFNEAVSLSCLTYMLDQL